MYPRPVNIPSLLLRLLLSLTVLLNGFGPTHVMAGSIASETASVEESPCPEHHATASIGAADDGMKDGMLESSDKQSGDCCKSSSCRCACVHVGAWVMAEYPYVPAHIVHDMSLTRMAIGHRSPTLPHLMRPPIV